MKELEKEALSVFQKMWAEKGFDELSSAILGILLIEPEEISMEELIEKTGYSAASICSKVKILASIGIISKRTKPGAKRIYPYMEKDFLKMLKEGMLKMKSKLEVYGDEIERLGRAYKEKASTEREKKQMKNIMMMSDYIIKVKPLFEEFTQKLEAVK